MSCQIIAKRLIYQCGRKVYFPYEQGEKCFTAYLNPIRERTEKIVPTESGVLHQGKWLMLAAAQDADPVSYTHLDVYKRQGRTQGRVDRR